jgi:hypothetical protein
MIKRLFFILSLPRPPFNDVDSVVLNLAAKPPKKKKASLASLTRKIESTNSMQNKPGSENARAW